MASDFDGTIAPIVANPSDARPIPAAADALAALAGLRQTTAALISGRALRDLAVLSGAPADVHLVGSHGSEFNADFLEAIDDSARSLLADLEQTMADLAARYPGATVETKPVSVAFHVRNAAPGTRPAGPRRGAGRRRRTGTCTSPRARRCASSRSSTPTRARRWTCCAARARRDAVVFFGDDVTDEKAFMRLGEADVGVKVGSGDTAGRLPGRDARRRRRGSAGSARHPPGVAGRLDR